MKIPLRAGAYSARSLIANAQRSVNLIAEVNPEETDPDEPVTHYPRPGLVLLNNPPTLGRGRGIFRVSNGDLYAVVGQNVYFIDANWSFNRVGQLLIASNNPVSMADNGISNGQTIVIVDGSINGYTINMQSRQFSQIVDSTGLFVGADRVDFSDTFFLFNQPGTNNWYISLSESIQFNALDIAAKGTFPDPIQSLIVVQRIIWLVGQMTAEPWFDAGDAIFPFEELPGQFVAHGMIAKYSLCATDVNAFWLSQDKDGQAIALMTNGYSAERISTHALETEWLEYPRRDDCITYTYQQGGHTIIVWHFPSGDKAWGYDLASKQWHQRATIDVNGQLKREKVGFHAFAYGTNIAQDWATGAIYQISQDAVDDAGIPIVCIRSFPHVVEELKEITVSSIVADFETGNAPNTGDVQTLGSPWSSGFSQGFGPLQQSSSYTSPWTTGYSLGFGPIGAVAQPMLAARVSKDGGATFGNHRLKGLIAAGHYRSMMRWRNWGMGRDWVIEFSWAASMKTSLQGAYIEAIPHGA